mgnify:CR=1 FL=1
MEVYTDGSCPDNLNIHRYNPAGWGFTFRFMHSPDIWHDSYGPVSTFPDDQWFVGAKVGSNNSAELTAIIEAIDSILRFPTYVSSIIFYVDSQYAIDIVLGNSAPCQNMDLVVLLRAHYSRLSSMFSVSLQKVKSHSGIEGNERADNMANLGVNSTSFTQGRFRLTPPDFILSHSDRFLTLNSHKSIESHYSSLASCLSSSSLEHLEVARTVRKQKICFFKHYLSHHG